MNTNRFKAVPYLLAAVAAGGTLVALCRRSHPQNHVPAPHADALTVSATSEPFLPLRAAPPLDPRQVALGERLFSDARLSHDNTISCATCHSFEKAGTDRLPRSVGTGGAIGGVNAPTVFNAALNFRQFWDGRSDTLDDQVTGPVQNASEMASSWPEIVAKLRASADYVEDFEAIYPDGLQEKNIRAALATFERSLATPNSRFDRYLRGDTHVLTDDEREGYRLFKAYGCASCHQGEGIGGNLFQRLGVFGDYFADRGSLIAQSDLGRFNVTGDEADRYVFKVPSLRNVALTAPYFHDGSASDLAEAVRVMSMYQLGRPLTTKEADQIAGFFETLSGEYRGRPL